jgi:hypothetical protein
VDISHIETIDEMNIPFDHRNAIYHCIRDKGAIWDFAAQATIALVLQSAPIMPDGVAA